MSFLVPDTPAPPKATTIPQPDDSTVKAAQIQQYADEQSRGANPLTNRMGMKGGSFGPKFGDYGAADTSGGSNIINGKA